MIYTIIYNDNELAGRVSLHGNSSKILYEYRLITRVIADQFGIDRVIRWTAGLANDNIKNVAIELDIQPETGGEYIPEEVRA